jgi:HSP20 family molecular chaperone IbpA
MKEKSTSYRWPTIFSKTNENNELIVYVEVPGFEKEDVSITYIHRTVIVDARKENHFQIPHKCKFFIPNEWCIEKGKATIKNGMLILTFLPKVSNTTRIEIE